MFAVNNKLLRVIVVFLSNAFFAVKLKFLQNITIKCNIFLVLFHCHHCEYEEQRKGINFIHSVRLVRCRGSGTVGKEVRPANGSSGATDLIRLNR